MIFGHWYVLAILLIIVLIVFGPGKLPEVGGAIGKAMREFRKASTDLQDEITRSTTVETPPTAPTAGDAKSSPEPKV